MINVVKNNNTCTRFTETEADKLRIHVEKNRPRYFPWLEAR